MKVGQRFNPHRLFTGVFIPDAIYHHSELTAVAKLLYGRLYKYAGESGEAYPAGTTLAAELKMSERQVFEHLSLLVSEGLIEREPRPGTSTVYHFLWHPCFEQVEEGVVRKTALPKSQERECGKPHYPSAENRTTGSAEILTLKDPIEESQGKDPEPPTPSSDFPGRKTTYTANPEDDPESSTYYGVARSRRSRLPGRKQKDPDRWKMKPAPGSGMAIPEAEPGQPAVFRGGVVVQTPPNQPAAPQRDFLADWNRMVPGYPVTDWNPKYDVPATREAFADPDFTGRFDDICERFNRYRSSRGSDGDWLTFRRLVQRSKNGRPHWFNLLAGEYDFEVKTGRRRSGAPDYIDALMKELNDDTNPAQQP